MEKELSLEIKKPKLWIVLGFLLAILYFELQTTLRSPIAFGDEGYHTIVAKWIGVNREYPVYTPLFGTAIQKEKFNRLPLWNILEGSFYFFFGFNELWIKFLVPFTAFLTALATYLIGKKVFSENVGFFAAIITAFIPSFITYSVLFYSTMIFVFLSTMAMLVFMLAIKTEERKYWYLTGAFSGLTFLSNLAGSVLFLIFGLFGLYKVFTERRLFYQIKKYGIIFLIAFLLVFPWVLRNINYYYVPGCTDLRIIVAGSCFAPETYKSQYSFEGRIAMIGTESSILNIGLPSYLNFAYGNLWFVPFTFVAGLFLLVTKRDLIDKFLIFTIIGYLYLFYISGGLVGERSEDTSRYMLGFVTSISLVSSIYLSSVVEFTKKYNKYIEVVLIIAIVFFAGTEVNKKLFGYEQNGSRFSGLVNIKQFSPNFFEACDWVKKNLPSNVIMFSLNTYPTIYNCERTAVWEIPDKADILLSNKLDLVLERLKTNGITHIFVQKFSLSSQALSQTYPNSFVDFLETNSNNFMKVFENGIPTQDCIRAGGCDGTIIYKVEF